LSRVIMTSFVSIRGKSDATRASQWFFLLKMFFRCFLKKLEIFSKNSEKTF